MTIYSHWESKESENTDWVSGKLALPLLASAFAFVDLRELWDYRISFTPMRFKPSWDLWSKKQEPRYVSLSSLPLPAVFRLNEKFISLAPVLMQYLLNSKSEGECCM